MSTGVTEKVTSRRLFLGHSGDSLIPDHGRDGMKAVEKATDRTGLLKSL